MEMHCATLWESIADAIPDQAAVSNGSLTRTWAQFDDRAARLAAAFEEAGLGPGSKVAELLFNGNEYLETLFAAQKMRGVAVNVNYRYRDTELEHLLVDSDAEALVFHASLGERVSRVAPRLPGIRLLVEVDDGTPSSEVAAAGYEDLIAGFDPSPRIPRSGDDLYLLYTGGTTGLPKGVLYRQAEHTSYFLHPSIERPDDVAALAQRRADTGRRHVAVVGPPLMHGTGLWLGATTALLEGGHVITLPSRSFSAEEMLSAIEVHRATRATIVGDAFALPIIEALDAAEVAGHPYDLASLRYIQSSGVMWTEKVKRELIGRLPHVSLVDSIGSTEGSMGRSLASRDSLPSTASFQMDTTTRVFNEHDQEVVPGSGEVGMVATSRLVPVAYHKDPERSARTFRVIDGIRYSLPGDLAKVEADGTLVLLGRGNNIINSGGEKILAEEVEEVIKRIGGVVDCLVVGTPDVRFGHEVVAVIALAPGADLDEEHVISSVKRELAGYKAPRRVVFVEEVPRGPSGKPDYTAARLVATRR